LERDPCEKVQEREMNLRAPFIPPKDSRGFDFSPDLSGVFEQYVEATPVGILVVDHAGTIIFVNRSLCSTFGYPLDELLGQPIEILVPDGIKPDHVRLRDSYIENPTQRLMVGREVRGRRKNGTEVVVAIGLNPMVSNGSVQVACTVMDLTPLKQAEQTLERFFDLSLDLFCIASTDGHFLRINSNFSRLLGFSDDELLARPFLEFVHPDDIAATQAIVAMLEAGQSVVQFRNRYGNLHGDYHWIEWSARSIPENGMIFAVGRDVTDEVRLSLELKVREQRERAILDNTPAVVYLKDTAGRYLYVNQRHIELFGKGHETLIGKTDDEVFSAELAEKFVENDRAVITNSATITTQEVAPHSDGVCAPMSR
jgi:PAS domain S-box-containing protein